ncbi:MAG: hypothetical protein WC352_02880 [Candidatus Omnitrophota bacterium]|jgi:hypothetical protein
MSETRPGSKAHLFLHFVFFLAGLAAGALMVLGAGPLASAGRTLTDYAAIRMGILLDTDVLHLRSGDTLRGRILSEDSNGVRFEVNGGVVKFSMQDILQIDRDDYARYLRRLR